MYQSLTFGKLDFLVVKNVRGFTSKLIKQMIRTIIIVTYQQEGNAGSCLEMVHLLYNIHFLMYLIVFSWFITFSPVKRLISEIIIKFIESREENASLFLVEEFRYLKILQKE